MKKPFISAGLLLVLLTLGGCARSGSIGVQQTPDTEKRGTVGNGGDSVRVTMQLGRTHASEVLERLLPSGFVPRISRALEPSEQKWILDHKAALANDIRTSPFVFTEEAPIQCKEDPCACTSLTPSATIYFSPSRCTPRIHKKEEAGRLLVHEAVHHWLGADEAKADRIAAAVYEAWEAMGHPDGAHWATMPSSPAPGGTVVQTGSKLVTWTDDLISEFDPRTGNWDWKRSENSFPKGIEVDGAVWAGEALVAFSKCGGSYELDFRANRWQEGRSAGGPTRRRQANYFSDGKRAIVWGGEDCTDGHALYDGGIYDPASAQWQTIPKAPLADGSIGESVVWTGDRLILWGGLKGASSLPALTLIEGPEPLNYSLYSALNSGVSFQPTEGRWRAIANQGAPSARFGHLAVWNGQAMIVYGGMNTGTSDVSRRGALYYPAQDRWVPMKGKGPKAEVGFHAAWTDTHLAVFGIGSTFGYDRFMAFYDPLYDEWTQFPSSFAYPEFPGEVSSYWTGTELIVLSPKHAARLFP